MELNKNRQHYDDIPLRSPEGDGLYDRVPETNVTNYDQMQKMLKVTGYRLEIGNAATWGKGENSVNTNSSNNSASFIVGLYISEV